MTWFGFLTLAANKIDLGSICTPTLESTALYYVKHSKDAIMEPDLESPGSATGTSQRKPSGLEPLDAGRDQQGTQDGVGHQPPPSCVPCHHRAPICERQFSVAQVHMQPQGACAFTHPTWKRPGGLAG